VVDNVTRSFARGITEPHYKRKRHHGLFLESVYELECALANHIGGACYGFTLKFAFLNRWPTKKPLLPPGDFLHIILLVGNQFTKLASERNCLAGVWLEIATGPEKIFYRISDDKRTSQISASAETLLRRWEFVGIGFFIFFLMMFLLIR
jgi:hypothetical protein